MHVEVKDPDDKEILSRVYSAEGNYTFVCLCFVCVLMRRGICMNVVNN